MEWWKQTLMLVGAIAFTWVVVAEVREGREVRRRIKAGQLPIRGWPSPSVAARSRPTVKPRPRPGDE